MRQLSDTGEGKSHCAKQIFRRKASNLTVESAGKNRKMPFALVGMPQNFQTISGRLRHRKAELYFLATSMTARMMSPIPASCQVTKRR